MTPRLTDAVHLTALLLAACAAAVSHAQTPGQMEYERQQREYRQQQEQKRQDQQRMQQLQNENARRQQEESNRAARQLAPSSPGSSTPSTSVNPPSAAPGGGSRPAQNTGSAEQRYAVPGHGTFVVQVPRDWKEQVRQTPNQPPTIVLGPASGSAFQVLLTPSWPEPKGRAPHTGDELRAAVGRGAQSAKSWAAESELAVRELQGRSGPGFYFSATERAPKPGTHKFVTTGILRVGELSVPFTITSGDGHASIVQQALEVLKSGVQEPAGAAAAASRTTQSVGTGAAGAVATAASGTASLSLAAGVSASGGPVRPVAGRDFFILKRSVSTVLTQGGVTPAAGVPPLKAWGLACRAQQPACQEGLAALIADSAAVTKTDAAGKGQVPALPAGTYYVFGFTHNGQQATMWDVRVDLKPGTNAITLGQRNASVLN